MKRIVAIITLAVAVLAVPATAMASTNSSGGSGGSQATVISLEQKLRFCPLPLRGIQVKVNGAVVSKQVIGQVKQVHGPVPVKQAVSVRGRVRIVTIWVRGKQIRCLLPIPRHKLHDAS
jgi:hypothetical protein